MDLFNLGIFLYLIVPLKSPLQSFTKFEIFTFRIRWKKSIIASLYEPQNLLYNWNQFVTNATLTVIFSIAISSVCRYIEITALLTAKYFSKYSIFFPGRKSWHLLIVLVSFVNFFIPQDLWETKQIWVSFYKVDRCKPKKIIIWLFKPKKTNYLLRITN